MQEFTREYEAEPAQDPDKHDHCSGITKIPQPHVTDATIYGNLKVSWERRFLKDLE